MWTHRVLVPSSIATALLCATPLVARAQQSVANGFPPETLSAPLGLPGTADIDSPLDTGDVNGDGLPDLVAVDTFLFGPPVYVDLFLGTPSGDLSPAILLPIPPESFLSIVQPILVDVDADGDLDIVAVYGLSGLIRVLRGHGDGQFDAPITSGGGINGGPVTAVVGDVDGDGLPDLVFSHPSAFLPEEFVKWSRGAGHGIFDPAEQLVKGRSPCAVVLDDLNADRIDDLAFMDSQTKLDAFVSVHLGLGRGLFGPGMGFPVGLDPEGRLVAADGDGDGDLDLYNYTGDPPDYLDGGVRILHGAGDGTFELSLFVPLPSLTFRSFSVADIDRDGVPDLVGADGGGVLKLQRMGLDGPIGPVMESSVPGVPNSNPGTAAADLDVDGHLDLVVTNDSQPVRFLNALEPIVDLGYGQSSSFGTPTLAMSGTPAAGQPITLQVQLGAALPGLLVIGASPGLAPFHGGVLVPTLNLLIPVVGGQSFMATWPSTIPPGLALYLQAVLAHGGQTANSNALVIVSE